MEVAVLYIRISNVGTAQTACKISPKLGNVLCAVMDGVHRACFQLPLLYRSLEL